MSARGRWQGPWSGLARCVVAAMGLQCLGTVATAEIASARYTDPTGRYDHAILGDAIEYGALEMRLRDGRKLRVVLPEARVFEDLAPRLADVDNDGAPEIITIETSLTKGARLAIYGETGLIAATPFIGRTHRWLAPLGAADLDGDGRIELAYVDRPHLARTLRVWRFENGKLEHVADLEGLTNHRIGQDYISGGIRICGDGAEIITANGDWSRIMATRLEGTNLVARDIGPFKGRGSLEAALDCND
ncbi:FG-GAP repeat domain-containing protein [Shimia aestuarii]|uniref:FG-GAP repeat domain-containing protein n=1 Tax=Shimia aestuarii TaxID=254406 RepID=UPI00326195D7